jgi:hypothetical protein
MTTHCMVALEPRPDRAAVFREALREVEGLRGGRRAITELYGSTR